MKLKSTLPSLFETIRSRNQQPDTSSASLLKTRCRQGLFYSIDLDLANKTHKSNGHRYTTKIINNSLKKKDRSLLFSRQNNEEDIQIPQQFSSMISSKYMTSKQLSKQYKTISVYENKYGEKSFLNKAVTSNIGHWRKLQQIDSVEVNVKKVQESLYLLEKQMEPVPTFHEELRSSIKAMGEKVQKEINELKTNYKQKIDNLGKALKKYRKQINVQLKTCRFHVKTYQNEQLEMKEVASTIDRQMDSFKNKYFD